MVYVITVCWQLVRRIRTELEGSKERKRLEEDDREDSNPKTERSARGEKEKKYKRNFLHLQ